MTATVWACDCGSYTKWILKVDGSCMCDGCGETARDLSVSKLERA